MAKINARGARLVHEWTTERVFTHEGEAPTTYREKWRLRSDGAILTRIIWTESEDRAKYAYYGDPNHPNRLRHSSGYRIWRTFKAGTDTETQIRAVGDLLRGKLGATILEEKWRHDPVQDP